MATNCNEPRAQEEAQRTFFDFTVAEFMLEHQQLLRVKADRLTKPVVKAILQDSIIPIEKDIFDAVLEQAQTKVFEAVRSAELGKILKEKLDKHFTIPDHVPMVKGIVRDPGEGADLKVEIVETAIRGKLEEYNDNKCFISALKAELEHYNTVEEIMDCETKFIKYSMDATENVKLCDTVMNAKEFIN